jgi:hypothetical protein
MISSFDLCRTGRLLCFLLTSLTIGPVGRSNNFALPEDPEME